MKKLLGPSFIMASIVGLAACDGDSQLPGSQATEVFTAAPQTLTTKTTALPFTGPASDLRSAAYAAEDIAFVGSANVGQVNALRLGTRQQLWQLTLDGSIEQLFFDNNSKRLFASTATTLYTIEPMTGAVLHSVAISTPVVAITYLPARNNALQDHLVIGQRSNSEWLLSALNPNTLETVASTTLPAVDEEPKLQITAGAGLIWTMNYEGHSSYLLRPYLLQSDAILPISDHQVVDSLRDTGLMISPDGEWLITGGNNVLSSALDSDLQTYYEANVHGFDHFAPTVTGGGVFWGDTFGLMVREDFAPSPSDSPLFDLGRFRPSQVLSTVTGVYALGTDHELGLAAKFVTSNRAINPSTAAIVSLSVDQMFVSFDGEESHQQAELYLTVKLAAGNGLATVQPVCYEPCTYAKTLEIPLLDESQQAYIDIHQLTDGPIAGVIVTAREGGQMGATRWLFSTPAFCSESSSSEVNQFTGDVVAGSLDLYMGSDLDMCEDDERTFGVVKIGCPDGAAECEKRFELGQLRCGGSSLIVDGNFGEGGNSPLLPIELINNASSSSSSSTPIYGEIGQETGSSSSERQPNDITGTINVYPDYLDNVSFQPSKTTCF